MKSGKIRLLALVIIAVIIRVISMDADWIERYYSNGVYPHIVRFQRMLLGWVPFSVGDLFYGWAVIWLIIQTVKLIRRLARRDAGRDYLLGVGRRFLSGALLIYISFNLLWGLNYNRRGIQNVLKLNISDYTRNDLIEVTSRLAEKLDSLQAYSLLNRGNLQRKKWLFQGTVSAYKHLSMKNELFVYEYPSVKPSIYSYLGNYLGFTGYYNPFSGEAQVNTTVPLFIRPFTSCHEIGHQLGYAKESEANFAGYLSASSSEDPSFLYSVYFDMFAYSSRYLYMEDSVTLKNIREGLSPGVRSDIRELREFAIRYSTPLETAIDRIYSQYLKANQQPSGRMSYNEVVALLIAYYRKYGRL